MGDVCMRFYDENGQETANTLGPLTMSIPLEDLKKIPNVVCLAAGKEKGDAILGGAEGRHRQNVYYRQGNGGFYPGPLTAEKAAGRSRFAGKEIGLWGIPP